MSENSLTAPELLTNRGIRFEAWKKWDKTLETLPCTGQKQYEPNNSWLQNKQIEKGLNDRRDLIGIQRVNRCCQLATAEWLPQESRARVTKKSGQEWTSFGLEDNFELYLIPEEALLLLELNCLQLTWDGVALSIQQGYRVLIGSDRAKCNLEEYRVYSHLVRQGYRLQRFSCGASIIERDSSVRSQRTLKRKKQIHGPLNGFGTTIKLDEPNLDHSSLMKGVPNTLGCIHENANRENLDHIEKCGKRGDIPNGIETGNQTDPAISAKSDTTTTTGVHTTRSKNSAEEVPKGRVHLQEETAAHVSNVGRQSSLEDSKPAFRSLGGAITLSSELYDNGVVNLPGPSNVEVKKLSRNNGQDSKLQIISDETLLGDFKMISKWPGTRIQRNVKWMPKRKTGETVPTTLETIINVQDKTNIIVNNDPNLPGDLTTNIIRKSSRLDTDLDAKSAKTRKRERTHEVIDVSDDEIEELPQKLSRTEMLNLFPNVISNGFIVKQMSRRYLPHNVWPQKMSNRFIKWKLSHEDIHRKTSYKCETSSANRDVQPSHATTPQQIVHSDFTSIAYHNESSLSCGYRILRQGSHSRRRMQDYQTTNSQYYNRMYSGSSQPPAQANRMVFGVTNHIPVHSGICSNVTAAQNIRGKSEFLEYGLVRRQNVWNNLNHYGPNPNLVHFLFHPTMTGPRPYNKWNRIRGAPSCSWDSHHHSSPATEISKSSFKIVPGALSWSETKAKWIDEKTITIEDEDCVNDDDSIVQKTEIELLPRPAKPLVGQRNATSLAQVYKSLQIIRCATNKNLARSNATRKNENYRISYNLYSTTQHFKKANPGNPMYRIVILRSEDTPFIELIEMERLKRDARGTPILLACASHTAVTFAELSTVEIPNIQDNYCER